MMRITPMVKYILIINVVVLLIQTLLSLPFSDWFGLRVVFADEFQPYQFVTYMWVHGGFYHLLGNMFAVFVFGPLLEQFWGPRKFLTFYLICGIGAGILFGVADFFEKYELKQDTEAYINNPDPDSFQIFILNHRVSQRGVQELANFGDRYYENPNSSNLITQSKVYVQQIYDLYSNIPMVGASGAVFGILMAFGMLFPNTQLFLLFPPIPIKAKYLVLFYGLYEVYSEFSRTAGDNIAHLAHLGGMLIAFIMIKYWQKKSGRFY